MVLPARHSVHHHFHTLCRFSHFIYINTKDIYVTEIFIIIISNKGGSQKNKNSNLPSNFWSFLGAFNMFYNGCCSQDTRTWSPNNACISHTPGPEQKCKKIQPSKGGQWTWVRSDMWLLFCSIVVFVYLFRRVFSLQLRSICKLSNGTIAKLHSYLSYSWNRLVPPFVVLSEKWKKFTNLYWHMVT